MTESDIQARIAYAAKPQKATSALSSPNRIRDLILILGTCAAIGFWVSSNPKIEPTAKASTPTATIPTPPCKPQISATPAGAAIPSTTISVEEVSIEGVRLGMTRSQVIKLWGPCGTRLTTQGSISEEILTQPKGRRDAFISLQGKVRTVLGETLAYRGHRLRPGANFADLYEVFGKPEVYEPENPPPKNGTWSYLNGAIQAHYNLQVGRDQGGAPKVYLYEIRIIPKW